MTNSECDSCNDTIINIECPQPSGLEGATLYSQYYLQPVGGQLINNGGLGYDVTIYTNNESVSRSITIETNMYISTVADPHTVTTTYKNDTVTVSNAGVLVHLAPTKSDHTHFMITETVLPGKSIKMNVLSDDVTGRLNWLVSMIYKY